MSEHPIEQARASQDRLERVEQKLAAIRAKTQLTKRTKDHAALAEVREQIAVTVKPEAQNAVNEAKSRTQELKRFRKMRAAPTPAQNRERSRR